MSCRRCVVSSALLGSSLLALLQHFDSPRGRLVSLRRLGSLLTFVWRLSQAAESADNALTRPHCPWHPSLPPSLPRQPTARPSQSPPSRSSFSPVAQQTNNRSIDQTIGSAAVQVALMNLSHLWLNKIYVKLGDRSSQRTSHVWLTFLASFLSVRETCHMQSKSPCGGMGCVFAGPKSTWNPIYYNCSMKPRFTRPTLHREPLPRLGRGTDWFLWCYQVREGALYTSRLDLTVLEWVWCSLCSTGVNKKQYNIRVILEVAHVLPCMSYNDMKCFSED